VPHKKPPPQRSLSLRQRQEVCCHGKGAEHDVGLGADRKQPQYRVGTVAMYGSDD
jgi:hypothetical protein